MKPSTMPRKTTPHETCGMTEENQGYQRMHCAFRGTNILRVTCDLAFRSPRNARVDRATALHDLPHFDSYLGRSRPAMFLTNEQP